ncbi:MAG: stage III sporulation protein AE [Tissierellia bacterium]|nr:stage III sporulation protein AE [Tissierellia bacterium]
MIINLRTIVSVFILILIFSSVVVAETGDDFLGQQIIEEQLNSLNFKELEAMLEDIVNTSSEYYHSVNIKDALLSAIKGEKVLDLKSVLSLIFRTITQELVNNLGLISQILVITIACSILSNLQNSFEKDNISQLANYACYIILSMMIINSFTLALDLGKNTVIKMVDFMQIILPILLALLTSIGSPGTKLLFNPVLLATVNIIGTLIKNFIFPLIFLTFIVGIISKISNKVQFNKISELMREIVVVIMGASFTVFIGIITIYEIGSNIDGITVNTAKFAVDSFIPIIGKFLSDAVEVVAGGSAILKNGLGMIGLISLILICLIPVIKILILIFVYKLVAALIQPITSEGILEYFNETSKSLTMILVGILSVAIMFFISISVIVEAGNAALMLR